MRLGGLAGVLLLESLLFVLIVGRGERGLVEALHFSSALGPFAAAVEFYVFLVLLEKVASSALSLRAFTIRPALTMAVSFVVLIALGTVLLHVAQGDSFGNIPD